MKKIVLNEVQAKKLMGKILSEQFIGGDRYHQQVRCSFGYHGLTYKGGEIDWIPDETFTVSFRIDMEARSYGIKSISVYDFSGPEEITISVTYFPEGSPDDDSVDEEAVVKVNWDNITKEKAYDLDWIGMSEDIEMDLGVDENGNFFSRGIVINTSTL